VRAARHKYPIAVPRFATADPGGESPRRAKPVTSPDVFGESGRSARLPLRRRGLAFLLPSSIACDAPP